MPVRIARDRTATSFQAGTRVNRERKTLNSLEPFKLSCIDHIVPVFPSHSLFFFVDARLQLSSSADPLFRDNRFLRFSAIVSVFLCSILIRALSLAKNGKDTIEGQTRYG